jgi:hypothetical protein
MWLYTFKSQFVNVRKKVVTKGMIIKGVYYTCMFYMHIRVCMHEHLDLIINPLKHKWETYQVFIHPSQEIMMSAKCNSWIMDLTHPKWTIQLMCRC